MKNSQQGFSSILLIIGVLTAVNLVAFFYFQNKKNFPELEIKETAQVTQQDTKKEQQKSETSTNSFLFIENTILDGQLAKFTPREINLLENSEEYGYVFVATKPFTYSLTSGAKRNVFEFFIKTEEIPEQYVGKKLKLNANLDLKLRTAPKIQVNEILSSEDYEQTLLTDKNYDFFIKDFNNEKYYIVWNALYYNPIYDSNSGFVGAINAAAPLFIEKRDQSGDILEAQSLKFEDYPYTPTLGSYEPEGGLDLVATKEGSSKVLLKRAQDGTDAIAYITLDLQTMKATITGTPELAKCSALYPQSTEYYRYPYICGERYSTAKDSLPSLYLYDLDKDETTLALQLTENETFTCDIYSNQPYKYEFTRNDFVIEICEPNTGKTIRTELIDLDL